MRADRARRAAAIAERAPHSARTRAPPLGTGHGAAAWRFGDTGRAAVKANRRLPVARATSTTPRRTRGCRTNVTARRRRRGSPITCGLRRRCARRDRGVRTTGFPRGERRQHGAQSRARLQRRSRERQNGGSAASAATTDGPPDTVRIATRGASGRCAPTVISVSIASKNSSVSSASTTRARPQAARNTSYEPVSEPVCESAARRPASDRPPFNTTTGFDAVARSAARTNRRPSRTASTKHAMSDVSLSSARYSSTSATSTSAWLPIERKRATPSPRDPRCRKIKPRTAALLDDPMPPFSV